MGEYVESTGTSSSPVPIVPSAHGCLLSREMVACLVLGGVPSWAVACGDGGTSCIFIAADM